MRVGGGARAVRLGPHASRAGLLVRGGDLSCVVGVPPVGNWSEMQPTGRLASVGLDQGPVSSLS
jgi:hypothetical protein